MPKQMQMVVAAYRLNVGLAVGAATAIVILAGGLALAPNRKAFVALTVFAVWIMCCICVVALLIGAKGDSNG